MKSAPFGYHAACTLYVTLLVEYAGADGRDIVGDQSFEPKFRLTRPDYLININGIVEWEQLILVDGALRIEMAEAMLPGTTPTESLFREAAIVAATVGPREDGQVGQDCRRRPIQAVVERALERNLS